MRAHGSRACYVFGVDPGGDRSKGCRCELCQAANRSYASFQQKRTRLKRSEGRWAMPYIDASPARDHLQVLRAAGIGRRQVHAATGLSNSILVRIRDGQIRRVRPATAEAILAVTPTRRAGGALIDAAPTWQLIDRLLAAGVTRARIGQAITGNPATAALQLGRDRITRRSADRIAAFAAGYFTSAEYFRRWRQQQRVAS